jgi:hypothetical protein
MIPLEVPLVPRMYDDVARMSWMDRTDASRGLGDARALLQRVVDALDGIFLHGDEEARGELGSGGARVEQSR